MTAESVEVVMRQFKKAIIERALGAEMTHHLGYESGGEKPEGVPNHRNGSSGKTVLIDDGPLRIDVPRDPKGAFEPQLIGKHERRFTGFDAKIISMYARGMTVREVQAHLPEIRRRRQSRPHQQRDRRRDDRSKCLARPAPGSRCIQWFSSTLCA